MHKLLFFFTLFFVSFSVLAQSRHSKNYYKNHPAWISMMNDTSENYYETVKAFREYFKERALPEEPNEVEGGDSFEREIGLKHENENAKRERESERESKLKNAKEPDYSAEVRAFKGWFHSNQPWVRSDGSMIGPKERQAIVDRQHEDLRIVESKNKK